MLIGNDTDNVFVDPKKTAKPVLIDSPPFLLAILTIGVRGRFWPHSCSPIWIRADVLLLRPWQRGKP